MQFLKKSASQPDVDPLAPQTKKERAKQYRQEAYQRAKEFRKTDPRQIALQEKQKEQRKEAYQKAKERNKLYTARRTES